MFNKTGSMSRTSESAFSGKDKVAFDKLFQIVQIFVITMTTNSL